MDRLTFLARSCIKAVLVILCVIAINFALIRAAPGAYLIVLLGGMAAGFIAPLGSIACGVGALLTSAYALLINAHLLGQAYRSAVETMGRG